MGCEDFLVHGRVSMLLFCLTYALFFNKIGYLCRGGSLSPSYTRILALHLYSLFFPILTSRIVYLSSSNSGSADSLNSTLASPKFRDCLRSASFAKNCG